MSAPYKLTPIHDWHSDHGAQMLERNGWIRVANYLNPAVEVQMARASVGICDVTPYSKINIAGPNSEAVIRQVFSWTSCTNVGTVCVKLYGDGRFEQIVRLASDRFLVLADPESREMRCLVLSDASAVREDVNVTDLTSAYSAIQLVGPNVGDLLKQLSSVDIEQLEINTCVQAATARVWSLIIRHEVTNGAAWLVVVSRDHGEYVWESVMKAGNKFGIQPFGMIAGRIITGMEALDDAIV